MWYRLLGGAAPFGFAVATALGVFDRAWQLQCCLAFALSLGLTFAVSLSLGIISVGLLGVWGIACLAVQHPLAFQLQRHSAFFRHCLAFAVSFGLALELELSLGLGIIEQMLSYVQT